jgi:hypothetical protein
VQVAQVADLAAAAHHAGDGQEAAAGTDAGHVERGYFADAEARRAGGPQHLQGGGDIGQQGGIVAVELGVQHALGQRLDALGVEGRPVAPDPCARLRVRRAATAAMICCRPVTPGRIARPGLRRQRRHAVFARQRQLRRIGQRQRRQGLQRLVLGAGDGAEEAQPVAQAVAGGELVEALARVAKIDAAAGAMTCGGSLLDLIGMMGVWVVALMAKSLFDWGTYKRPAGRSPRVWIGRKLPAEIRTCRSLAGYLAVPGAVVLLGPGAGDRAIDHRAHRAATQSAA